MHVDRVRLGLLSTCHLTWSCQVRNTSSPSPHYQLTNCLYLTWPLVEWLEYSVGIPNSYKFDTWLATYFLRQKTSYYLLIDPPIQNHSWSFKLDLVGWVYGSLISPILVIILIVWSSIGRKIIMWDGVLLISSPPIHQLGKYRASYINKIHFWN